MDWITNGWVAGSVVAGMVVGACMLHLIGRVSRAMSDWFCRAPGVDGVILYFMVAPWVGGAIVAGWPGVASSIVGQIVGLWLWIIGHELCHPVSKRGGPRIASTLNRIVGLAANHAALWWTAVVLPGFVIVRLAQYIGYPPLTWWVRFPKYKSGEWINVSRHKFEGLIGYDLIWCLYCDWMTGVWSLGSEMLRNVESFWCPIRFYEDKKCENCKVDFPDVENGWVAHDGTMQQVTEVLESRYDGQDENAWYGHPVRITVEGNAPPAEPPDAPESPEPPEVEESE